MERFYNYFQRPSGPEKHRITDALSKPDADDIKMIRHFLGAEAYEAIQDYGGVFYVKRPGVDIVENANKFGKSMAVKADVEFAVRSTDRVLMFYGYYEKHKIVGEPKVFDKYLIVNFMFKDDFLHAVHKSKDIMDIDLYRSQRQKIGRRGMNSEALTFLRNLADVAKMLEEDCLISLKPADSQRQRIYEMLFKNHKNIVFED